MERKPIERFTDELTEIYDSLEILAKADALSFRDVLEHAETVFSTRQNQSPETIQDAVQKLALVTCRSVFRKIDDVSGDPVTHQIFIDMLKDIERENALRQARLTAYNFHFHNGKYVQDVADENMKRIIDNFEPRSYSDGFTVYQAVIAEMYRILSESGQAVPLEFNMPVKKMSIQKVVIEWNNVPELDKVEYSPIIRQLFKVARQAVTESKTVRQSNSHYVYILDADESTLNEKGEKDKPEYLIYRRFNACACIGGENSMSLNTSAHLDEMKAYTEFLTALNLTDIQKERLLMKASGMTFRDMCMKDGRYTVSHPSGKIDKNGKPVMVKFHGSKLKELGYVIQPNDKITYSTRCYQDSLNQVKKKADAYIASLDDYGVKNGMADKYAKMINRIMGIELENTYQELALIDANENLTVYVERERIRKHIKAVKETASQLENSHDAKYNAYDEIDGLNYWRQPYYNNRNAVVCIVPDKMSIIANDATRENAKKDKRSDDSIIDNNNQVVTITPDTNMNAVIKTVSTGKVSVAERITLFKK